MTYEATLSHRLISLVLKYLQQSHCKTDNFSDPDDIKVSCGAHRRGSFDTNEQRLTVTEIIDHPNYDHVTKQNDIAVVKVSGSFDCRTDTVFPACLPNPEVRAFLNNFLHRSFIQYCRDTPMLSGRIPLSLAGVCWISIPFPHSCGGWRFLRYQTPLVSTCSRLIRTSS